MEADKNKIGKFINIRLLRSNIFYKEGRFAIDFTMLRMKKWSKCGRIPRSDLHR